MADTKKPKPSAPLPRPAGPDPAGLWRKGESQGVRDAFDRQNGGTK